MVGLVLLSRHVTLFAVAGVFVCVWGNRYLDGKYIDTMKEQQDARKKCCHARWNRNTKLTSCLVFSIFWFRDVQLDAH
jgi:hypothetical protein